MNNNTNKCKWKHDLVARCASVIISTRSARALLSSSSATAVAVKLNQHARCSYHTRRSPFLCFTVCSHLHGHIRWIRRLRCAERKISKWPEHPHRHACRLYEQHRWVIQTSLPQTYLILPRRRIVRSSCRLSRKQNTNTGMTECLYPCIAHWC